MKALLVKMDQKPTYPVGRVNGAKVPIYNRDDFVSSSDEDDYPDNNQLYEEEFVKEEMEKYAYQPTSQSSGGFGDDVSAIGDLYHVNSIVPDGKSEPAEVYQKYNFKLKSGVKSELPIDSFKSQILSRIELNQVIVIEGPTGCGKTTQVPQMVMDDLREKNEYCNIVVTQPRKIATINVAKRVCEERGWALGTVCGYQVGLEKRVSRDQVITYMTLGVLLQKIIRAKSLREYTHIIIDEVHERNQELDFLLLIVRKFLFTNSPHVKVILMSATINADEFAFYFRKHAVGHLISAPIIKVNKISQYSKVIFYLDQMSSVTEMPRFDIRKPEISEQVWNAFLFLVKVFDKLDRANVGMGSQATHGSVLVFLPGINEIEDAHNLLIKAERQEMTGANSSDSGTASQAVNRLKWDIIPLHSSLPNDEQAQAFFPPKPGHRKIILSTNIAESSVTVPDSCYVIDFCLTKVMTVDPLTKYMSLKIEWASHVNCNQRAGRVGRTCDGRIYRLVTESFYTEEMEKMLMPEILRAPLERMVLQAKMLELQESPAQILALALKPPNLKNIEVTVWQLKEIGGLLKTCHGLMSNSDGDITFLGKVMANLPIDVHLSKMIVLGQFFSCLEETIIIAAGCSIQNIFSVPFQKRMDAYRKVLLWADGSCSDLIALLNLYSVWQRLNRENAFASKSQESDWCRRNLVNLKGLREWHLLVTEIKQRLEWMQIKDTVGPGKVVLSNIEKPTVLKVVMAGAFYPNYFIKSKEFNQTTERDAVKTLGGRNPYCTVYLTGLDPRQPGQIYVRQIKRMIRDRDNETDVQIGFDGSMKVYVEFKNALDPIMVNVDGFTRLANITERIPTQIYEMIRKRQLKYDFDLRLLPMDKAWQFAEKHGSRTNRGLPLENIVTSTPSSTINCFSAVDYSVIPTASTQFIQVQVSHPVDAGHFWAQNADDRTIELLQKIDEALNKQVLRQVEEQPKVGKIYVAKFKNDGLFYRCRLTATAGRYNQVLFIDYGNYQRVDINNLYHLPQRPQCFTPALAFECVMHGIRPPCKDQGNWNEHVNELFKKWTLGIVLFGEVYSVVNDVIELTIYRTAVKEKSLNKYMIDGHHAKPAAPSFLSKQDHERRLIIQSSTDPLKGEARMDVDKIVNYRDFADPQVSQDDCIMTRLKGPFSPLEAKLFGCTTTGGWKSVDVEGSSVNAVLLDTEPESLHARLLVAAYVGQTSEGSRLKLRQTTLMPNLPGLPMLMAALFCPTMEPKPTADNTLVAAILCGLGYNEATLKPLFPLHDMLIRLDTELRMEELEMINRVRYLMNNALKVMGEMEQSQSTQNQLLSVQIKLKEHLFRLINLERLPINRQNVFPRTTTWGRDQDVSLLTPNMANEDQDIWALLGFIKIIQLSNYEREIVKNLEDIENMLYDVKPFEELRCLLCEENIYLLSRLRLHIINDEHKSKVDLFKYNLELSEDDEDQE
ncbi:probable ATP-dependent RNA helicase spindle-E [Euwallacea similis]|uniref:probable ATP-dependent RNA helicase spindle-E n=1 Tax=Euwallacea similis TaxID=1736056 RepID=UPI00344D4DA2